MSKPVELKLYSPLHVEMAGPDHRNSTVFLEGVAPEKKAACTEMVRAALQKLQPLEDARSAFFRLTGGYPNINEKIISLLHTTELVEGRLYGVTICKTSEALSQEEIEDLKYECRDFFDSGCGAGFAYCPREAPDKGLYIHFERNSGDPLMTRAELDSALKDGRISNQLAVTEVNKNTFWTLIHEAKRLWGQDLDGSVQWLENQLLMMGPEQARNFNNIVYGYQALSHKYGLWSAASVMLNGCSDDSFLDFQCWLIAQGRDVFLAALKDPDSLADVPLYEHGSFPSLSCLGESAYEKMTGKSAYADHDPEAYHELKAELEPDIEYGDGIGYPYKWKDAAAYLPRLCAKYVPPQELEMRVRANRDIWNTTNPDIKNARKTETKSERVKARTDKKVRHRGGDAR